LDFANAALVFVDLTATAEDGRRDGERIMHTIPSEVFEAFTSIGVPQEQALKAAAALSRRDVDVEEIKSRVLVLQWMQGFTLAMVTAIMFKLFGH
jgi:hypothetical protein